jgi:hypothetical protein
MSTWPVVSSVPLSVRLKAVSEAARTQRGFVALMNHVLDGAHTPSGRT